MQRVAVLMVGWLAVGAVQAGMYKCTDESGRVTFSQVQCAEDAEKYDAKTGGKTLVSSRKATQDEITACLDRMKIRYRYKDPDSLRVDEPPTLGVYGDGHVELFLNLNAKNSYGAYAGKSLAVCRFNSNGVLESATDYN